MRSILPSGDVLSSREEILTETAKQVDLQRIEASKKVEDKYEAIKEATRRAEMAVGKSRIKLIALKQQFERDYPRLEVKLTSRYVAAEDKVKYKIQVAHREQHIYLIDEEEDQDVFPSEWLLARMGLVG